MATKRSSVDAVSTAESPKVGARAAKRRGDRVPITPSDRDGRTTSDTGRTAGASRAARGRSRPAANGRARGGAGRSGRTALAARPTGWRWRLRTTLELIRANPTGRVALKIFIAVAGALVVTVGIALIPLPGPGWLIVIAGLAIWAVEFHWARRLLGFTRRHVHAWTRWATTRSLPVRFLLGSVGLVFVAVVLWLSLKYSLGIDLVAQLLRYLATT
ncbi:TIGR02611 family protein [Micromonospora sp. NPDC048894]|uniref:TIGR02611 family protein n=1 Tax=Micromonospora antibiotica TaxID=2807623 RepID=A0ABS3VFH2_9ACTN|nr:TIGR02611 family protein [Micromonospora antibiotica]MBO4164325.1 TIGR02611 family protein [Micromonospora antibiotica]